jgi:hypothetical protein
MNTTFLQQFWDLVRGALTLNPAVFDSLGQYSQSRGIAITIILLAGLSQAIGQSIVLFANRVKPFRFVLSLGTAALIYFATYLGWVLSIWFVVDVIFQGEFTVISIATALALCYAPQLLGFLVAFPYFGMPIAIVLSIWTLLAILVGLEATTTLNGGQTMLAAGLGWVVLHKQLYQFLAIVFSTFLVIGLIATTQRGFVLWFEALEQHQSSWCCS